MTTDQTKSRQHSMKKPTSVDYVSLFTDIFHLLHYLSDAQNIPTPLLIHPLHRRLQVVYDDAVAIDNSHSQYGFISSTDQK